MTVKSPKGYHNHYYPLLQLLDKLEELALYDFRSAKIPIPLLLS